MIFKIYRYLIGNYKTISLFLHKFIHLKKDFSSDLANTKKKEEVKHNYFNSNLTALPKINWGQ